jgi:hypothetical protein
MVRPAAAVVVSGSGDGELLLALVEDQDRLGTAVGGVPQTSREELRPSQPTLVEHLPANDGEGRDAERVITTAAALVDVRGDVDTVVAAASDGEGHGIFRSMHSIPSGPTATPSSPATTRPRGSHLGSIRDQ